MIKSILEEQSFQKFFLKKFNFGMPEILKINLVSKGYFKISSIIRYWAVINSLTNLYVLQILEHFYIDQDFLYQLRYFLQ